MNSHRQAGPGNDLLNTHNNFLLYFPAATRRPVKYCKLPRSIRFYALLNVMAERVAAAAAASP